MIIIALKGKNGSGKSTTAALISKALDKRGLSNKVLSFAEPLKKITDKLFTEFKQGFDWEDRQTKTNNRSLLEETANVIKSSFSFNPFLEQMFETFWKEPDYKVYIISDLRFLDEYTSLKDYQDCAVPEPFIVIEIVNSLTQNNPSEYDLDKILVDYSIEFNNQVEQQIEEILDKIL